MYTDEYDAWLIAWGAWSDVGAHDHGDSSGAIRVLRGSLEEVYREGRRMGAAHDPPGPVDRRAAESRARRVESGGACGSEPARVLAAAAADEFLSRGDAARSHGVTSLSVEAMLERARAGLQRVSPEQAAAAVRDGALLVDIRPVGLRVADGEIPGALVIDRNVLEWRLAPASDVRIPEVDEHKTVILFCDEGYASSLAAATLQELGLPHATDLDGGFQAWKRAGLPVTK